MNTGMQSIRRNSGLVHAVRQVTQDIFSKFTVFINSARKYALDSKKHIPLKEGVIHKFTTVESLKTPWNILECGL